MRSWDDGGHRRQTVLHADGTEGEVRSGESVGDHVPYHNRVRCESVLQGADQVEIMGNFVKATYPRVV